MDHTTLVSVAPSYRRWLLIVALSLTVIAAAAVPSAQRGPRTTELANKSPRGASRGDAVGPSADMTSTTATEETTTTGPTSPTTTPRVVLPKPPAVSPTAGINADGLWIRSRDGALRAFPHPLDGGRYSASWTPDSGSIYVSRVLAGEEWSLSRYDLSGSSQEFDAPTWVEPVAVSDSGRYLLKNRGALTGEVVDLTTGAVRKLDDFMVTWLPNADVLVTPKGKTIPMNDEAPGQIPLPGGYVPAYQTFVSSNQKRIVGIEASAIEWFDIGGELHRVQADTAIDTYMGCAFQRDGSHVACPLHQGETSWVMVVDLNSGDVRKIPNAWAVAYAPNGRLTYAEETDSSFRFLQRVMIESDAGPVELLPAARIGQLAATPLFLNWSPDGQFLAIEISPYGDGN